MISTHQRHVPRSLRHATALAHHELDHHPLLQRLTARDLTREHYAESLAALYLPHVLLERQVHESAHHAESGLALTSRCHLLEADLRDLGWPAPPALPRVAGPLEGCATWWGRVYVLEGSRQGGSVIAERIRSNLGAEVPSRFFSDARCSPSFEALSERLAQELADPQAFEQAVSAARDAFAAFRKGLDDFYRWNINSAERTRGLV